MRRLAAAVAIGVLTACAGVPAPDLDPPGPQSAGELVAHMRLGELVGLHRARSGLIAGRLVARTPDGAVVAGESDTVTVPLALVDTVWRHRPDVRRAVTRGLLGGFIAAGALTALLIATDCKSCDDPGLWRLLAPPLFGIGASVGAVLGATAVLGPEWRVGFPAPRRRGP